MAFRRFLEFVGLARKRAGCSECGFETNHSVFCSELAAELAASGKCADCGKDLSDPGCPGICAAAHDSSDVERSDLTDAGKAALDEPIRLRGAEAAFFFLEFAAAIGQSENGSLLVPASSVKAIVRRFYGDEAGVLDFPDLVAAVRGCIAIRRERAYQHRLDLIGAITGDDFSDDDSIEQSIQDAIDFAAATAFPILEAARAARKSSGRRKA